MWSCIENLLREAFKMSKPGARLDLVLGFACKLGKHRSVCISKMRAAVLTRMGIDAETENVLQITPMASGNSTVEWLVWLVSHHREETRTKRKVHGGGVVVLFWLAWHLRAAPGRTPSHPRWRKGRQQATTPSTPQRQCWLPGSYGQSQEKTKSSVRGLPGKHPETSTRWASLNHSSACPTSRRTSSELTEQDAHARHVKIDADEAAAEATREAGRACRRARGETAEQSRTDPYPISSDLVFILPKLLLSHSPGKEKARDRLHRVQDTLQRASQREWPDLIRRAIECPLPKYEQEESQPLATRPDSLPTRTARLFPKAASRGQLGKAWRQLRAPPPVFVGPDQRIEALAKFTPHERQGPSLSERASLQNDGFPLPGSATKPSRSSKKTKLPMREGGPLRAASATHAWSRPFYTGHTARPAERTLAYPPLGLLRQGGGAIRPILIGMMWSKLLSHLLLKPAKSDLEVFLRDRQFGIGNPRRD